jgi:hypothetical protein
MSGSLQTKRCYGAEDRTFCLCSAPFRLPIMLSVFLNGFANIQGGTKSVMCVRNVIYFLWDSGNTRFLLPRYKKVKQITRFNLKQYMIISFIASCNRNILFIL